MRGFLVRFPIQRVLGAHSPMDKVAGAWRWSLIYLVTAPSTLTTTNIQLQSGASSGNADSETADWEFIAEISSTQRIFAWSILINARKHRAPTFVRAQVVYRRNYTECLLYLKQNCSPTQRKVERRYRAQVSDLGPCSLSLLQLRFSVKSWGKLATDSLRALIASSWLSGERRLRSI